MDSYRPNLKFYSIHNTHGPKHQEKGIHTQDKFIIFLRTPLEIPK